ncbi:hypothetical protein ACQJBY_002071 [Aegilops geniculata]
MPVPSLFLHMLIFFFLSLLPLANPVPTSIVKLPAVLGYLTRCCFSDVYCFAGADVYCFAGADLSTSCRVRSPVVAVC